MQKIREKSLIFLSADLFLLSSQRGTQSVWRSDWLQTTNTKLFGRVGRVDNCLKQHYMGGKQTKKTPEMKEIV